jgi:hypothetical protein
MTISLGRLVSQLSKRYAKAGLKRRKAATEQMGQSEYYLLHPNQPGEAGFVVKMGGVAG